ncbi:BrnT family toxin [Candidatus Parcubacteria bacterium]|nr:BrnT family toxin [Candidatus Parcubacteria bacterium]
MINLSQLEGFDWDDGNAEKNWAKHKVTPEECEEAFFDEDKKITKDKLHSNNEDRYIFIGKTTQERLLYSVFTVRNNKIRIISSRDINKKEIQLYEKTT